MIGGLTTIEETGFSLPARNDRSGPGDLVDDVQ